MKMLSAALGTVILVLGLAGTVQAWPANFTTADGNGVDDDVTELNPDSNWPTDETFLELRSRDVTDSTRHRLPFLRFDISSLPYGTAATNATLTWYHEGSASGFNVDVFGVVDGVTGEDNWTADGLTYSNAPGFSSHNYPDPDRNHAPGETTLLGSVAVTGSGSHSLTSTALKNFVNADTNGVVTFILEPQEAASGEDWWNNISSAEHSTTAQRPQLSLQLPAGGPLIHSVSTDVDSPVDLTDIGTDDWVAIDFDESTEEFYATNTMLGGSGITLGSGFNTDINTSDDIDAESRNATFSWSNGASSPVSSGGTQFEYAYSGGTGPGYPTTVKTYVLTFDALRAGQEHVAKIWFGTGRTETSITVDMDGDVIPPITEGETSNDIEMLYTLTYTPEDLDDDVTVTFQYATSTTGAGAWRIGFVAATLAYVHPPAGTVFIIH